MTLSAGTRLGHYEILEPIGAGGVGEVFRARDTKLKRDVAIKVLPEAFARDEQRMKRFAREAEVLASLNHPNIEAIYGLEESDGITALVLELVEGPTLAERIAQGPIPLEEALPSPGKWPRLWRRRTSGASSTATASPRSHRRCRQRRRVRASSWGRRRICHRSRHAESLSIGAPVSGRSVLCCTRC
ncbi:MAG: hypothetical protein E2P02_05940 [Acidobacteria bacterium]|nr:MAG: hypothetical protein E2P02_05940 [Acidobacteriota bacterium]